MKNDLTAGQLQQPVTVTLPLGVLLNITENEDCVLVERAPALKTVDLPAIGAAHYGGIYAGLSLENEQPVALVLLPEDLEPTDWKGATAWAKKQGGMLPSRIDHLVLFKNLKKEFQETWYWSSEQRASVASYAWVQHFGYGDQYFTHQVELLPCSSRPQIDPSLIRSFANAPELEGQGLHSRALF